MATNQSVLDRIFRNNQKKIGKFPRSVPQRGSTPYRKKMELEPLEQRVLLSSDPAALLAQAAFSDPSLEQNVTLAPLTGNSLTDSLQVVAAGDTGSVASRDTAPDSGSSAWDVALEGAGSVGVVTVASLESLSNQMVFLSFDGADDVDYDGPIHIEDIDIDAFHAPWNMQSQRSEIIDSILATLETIFAGKAVDFSLSQPVSGAYSTIYMGGDGAEFSEYGRFQGLSEKIDLGNADHSDNAFVFTDNIFAWTYDARDYGQLLGGYAAHELGHLLGYEHAHDLNSGNPLSEVAWDPRVHVAIANEMRDDLLADDDGINGPDGTLTINNEEYVVHPLVVAALKDWQPYYNAGVVGPDGFPDVLMGQMAMHAVENGTWLTRVLDMAWAAQSDASYSAAERSQILAFSFGVLAHSAGDHFAHTLVNEFAEGIAPGFVAAAQSSSDLGNMLRHFLSEAYIADALPGFDSNKDTREQLADGDWSNVSTPGIEYKAPIRFVYETLVRAFPDDPTVIVEMSWQKGTLVIASGATESTFTRDDIGIPGLAGLAGFKWDGFVAGQKITVSGFNNNANNGEFIVKAVTDTVLTVAGTLVNETASGDEKIVVHVPKTGITTITISADRTKFVRAAGSFKADGFAPEQRFSAYGFSSNFDNFIVKSVTDTELEVYGKLAADAGAGTGNEQLVVYGKRGPIIDGLFKLRDKLFKEAVERGDRETESLGDLIGELARRIVDGDSLTSDGFDGKLFKTYLYNWADEIDDGIRNWAVVGQAFTRAMFDAQSLRDLQNKVGAAFGADSDTNTARINAEKGVGILSVLIEELDDPNGDGFNTDSYINNHLLPMVGLPSQLGLLRTLVQSFFDLIAVFDDPATSGNDSLGTPFDDDSSSFNPSQTDSTNVEAKKAGFIKSLFKKRYGVDFEVFEFLIDRYSKMDLKSITLPVVGVVPVFKPGDHEKLDAYMGMGANHHDAPPADFDSTSGFDFYDDAEGHLKPDAQFSTTNFVAYRNSVQMTKLVMLMESPAFDMVAGAGAAAGQLSALYSNILTELNGVPTTYDFSLLNLNGAHGGNIFTATLPGVAGTDGRPWLESIDADSVWRTDSHTTTSILFRVSYNDTALSPAEYQATVDSTKQYKVYATWQSNVTQKTDNVVNSNFPDQRITLDDDDDNVDDNAIYRILDGASPGTQLALVKKDQRLFATDFEHEGLAYSQLGTSSTTYQFSSGIARFELSNQTLTGKLNVIAGPIILVEEGTGTVIVIQSDRDLDTLAFNPGSGYTDNSAYWTDLVYPTGPGNNPLWESALLRPVFRELFDDWKNSTEFPDLGDDTSPDPNTAPIAKSERLSHATPTGPVFPVDILEIPIFPSVRDFILDGLNDLVDFVETLESAPPFNFTLPGLDRSIKDLLNLSGKVNENVRQPIVDYFAGDPTPTFGELFAVIQAKIGGHLDTLKPVIEFDVDVRKMFSVNDLKIELGQQAAAVGLELDGTLDFDAQIKFVDSVIDNLPVFTFGINLDPSTTNPVAIEDRVYFKVERVLLSGDIHVTDLDFGARLGFLGIGIEDAQVDLDADISIVFNDPNTDGKITLGEIADTPLSSLLTITKSGVLDGKMNVVATLAGLSTTLGFFTFHASDIFNLNTFNVDFTSNLSADAFNFKNMTAAQFVSLIAGFSDQLQDLRDSKFFTDLEIPFIKGAVTDVLDFADSIHEGLLFDDGTDEIADGADRLATDLNDAFAAAEISQDILVEGTGNGAGTGLKFYAIDPKITGFTIGVGTGDGGGFAELGVVAGGTPATTFTANPPALGRITQNAVLKIIITRASGSETHLVSLKAADTSLNSGTGNDRIKLVRADNSATFDTAQELAFRLTQVLALTGIVNYNAADDSLTVNVGALLPRAEFSKDFPVDFDLNLGSLAGIESNSIIRVEAKAGFDTGFIFGVYLGETVPGAVSNLTLGTPLTQLNDGDSVDIKKTQAITAPADVKQIHGRLQSDATFTLEVNTGTTTISSYTVKASDTSTNNTTADLVTDINNALAIASVRSGAVNTYVLGTDAVFTLTSGGVVHTVTVTAASTTGNTNLADLVADIVTALQTAKDPALATVNLTTGTHQLTAAVDGPQIVLKSAAGGVAEFSMNVTAASPAETILHLPAGSTTGRRLNNLVTAVADGDRLGLVAVHTVAAMKLTANKNDSAVKELGFLEQQTAAGPFIGSNLDNFILESDFGNALFKLKIGATTYDVTITPAATSDNGTTLANLVADFQTALTNAKISGTATTVNLSTKIQAVASGTSAVSLKIIDNTIFSVDLTAAIDNPAVFDLGLSDDATFTRPLIAAVKDTPLLVGRVAADTAITLTIDGTPIPFTLYADDTATNTTILSLVADLNQALNVASIKSDAISAFNPGGNIGFNVSINGSSPIAVTVLGADTTGNTTLSDLILDINKALEAAGLAGLVTAKPSGVSSAAGQARIKLEGSSDAIRVLTVTATAGNALGLPTSRTATSLMGRMAAESTANRLILTALNSYVVNGSALSAPFTLASDTTLGIQIGAASPILVVVKAADTSDNTRLEHLVRDLNIALGDKVDGRIHAEVNAAGNGIVLRSLDPSITGFTITAGALGLSGVATLSSISSFSLSSASNLPDLGFPSIAGSPVTSNSLDLVIHVSNPGAATQPYVVNLDTATTLQDVKNLIEAATFGKVEVTINAGQTGLTLRDTTFVAVVVDSNGVLVSNTNATTFRVGAINGSAAGLNLGILGVDSLDAANLDGKINGGQISGIKLTDRFFMANATVSADLEISTPQLDANGNNVDTDGDTDKNDGINATAHFGFVEVSLTGGGSLTAHIEAGFQDPTTGASPANDGRITLTEFIAGLGNIAKPAADLPPNTRKMLELPALTGDGGIDLKVEVDGIPFINPTNASIGLDILNLGDIFDHLADEIPFSTGVTRTDAQTITIAGSHGSEFGKGATITIGSFKAFAVDVDDNGTNTVVKIASDKTLPVSLTGLKIGTPLAPAINFRFTGLEELLAFENVNFNLSAIIDALVMLANFLSEFDAIGGALNEPIPLVNVSVMDLLSFADKLSDALDNFKNNPAGALQILDAKISEAFGVNPASNLLVFALDGNVLADTSDDILKIELNLSESFNKSLNVEIPGIDLGLPGELAGAMDFSGAASLAATGSAALTLHLGIGLNDPSKLYLYKASGLTGNLALSANDMAFRAGLGPFSLSIADGSASIVGTLGLNFPTVSALFDSGGRARLDTAGAIGNLANALEASISAPVEAHLPIFFPTDSHGLGEITLLGDLTDIANGFYVKTEEPDAGVPADTIVLDVSQVIDGIVSGFENMSLLDQMLFVVDGIDMVLGGVQDALDGEILGFELPLVGDSLKDGAHFIDDFRNDFLVDFRDGIEDMADPNDDAVKSLLFSLLGPSGLNILKKMNGDSGGTLADIQKFSNLDSATSISTSEIWWKFKIGQSKEIPNDIGFDIGIPGLGLETEGEIVLTLGWELDFGFGLSGADGFFFFVDDADELKLTFDVTLPDASLRGTLGFLEFTAENKDVDSDGDETHLSASLAINIKNASNNSDARLGLSELGRLGFEVLVGAEASVELDLTLGLAGDEGGFPQIKADFILDWAIDANPNQAGIQKINLFNPGSSFNFARSIQSGLQRVEFLNVSLDVGAYITEVVGPLVREIKDVTEPVQPIIDIVTTPLPVLADLGLDITLLDIAKQTGVVDPRFIDALEIILEVVTIVNNMEMPADGSLLVPFGDFTVYDRSNAVFDSLANFDLGSADFDLDNFAEQILDGPLGNLISGLPSGLQDVIGEAAGVAGDILKGLADKSGVGSKKPFSFPILEDPSQIFGMLMGTPAVLVAYDMPPLNFEAEFSAFFSIFGPLGVSINLEAALNIDFAFGYDTKGFTDFADSGFKNPLLLANGLFVSDHPSDPSYDGSGDDPPELTFNGGLWAAAELNLGIARGGVGGGIFIDVDFNLFDPDHDGRVRLDELIGNVLNQLRAPVVAERFLAPLAVFDVHGKVTAELFAFLKIDFGFFELDKKFNITPPLTLAEFDVDFFRPPVLATELGNGDLLINIGDFAAQRVLGDTTDFGEHIFIEDAGAGKVAIWSDNLADAGSNAKQIYSVSGKIIAAGGEGDDIIDLSMVTSGIRYDLEGGVGQDTLKGSGGGGVMRGGVGDDLLLKGGAGNDLIFGDEGKDIIQGGAGNDIVFGDGGEVPPDFNLADRHGFVRGLYALTDGDDTISGEGGDDVLIGSGGIDTITGGTGNDLIIGDSALLSYNSPAVVTETDDDPTAFGDILKGGDNDDIIYGGKGNDDIEGEGGADIIYGESGSDDLDGGIGNDIVFGDSGKFINGNLSMPAVLVGGDADLIHGGTGNDKLLGGGGSDTIYGDDGNDSIEGGTGADTLYGGADNDTILGGSDPDKLYGDAGNDVLEGGQGNDKVYGGAGVDSLIAGYGSDILDGEGDSDQYLINARGGNTTELTTVYDSGGVPTDTDLLTVLGTGQADVFLLRAMADTYFPKVDKKLEPALERAFIKIDLLDDDEARHELIRDYIMAAYGPHEAPQAMLDALDAVDLSHPQALNHLKAAVAANYVTELTALGSDTDTAFVALLNNGGATVERFNYRNIEGLVLNTVGGADLVVTDDVTAATTINLGTGDDRVQVGQVFRSERVVSDPPLITNIAEDDVFMTIEITRGWLSNGVSVATTVNGGDGNDEFTVFHNIAVLNLNGGDGDDLFTVRAFALAGSTDSERGRTDMKGDAGADTILYAMNAPVGIDGGDGFDTVRIIGTEFADDFVVTDSGVFGAGLNVSYANIEKLVADGAEGDDRFFVLSTGIEVVTELDGGLGSDSFFVGGSPSDAPIPVTSNDFKGHSGIILHSIETGDPAYQGLAIDGVSANVADNEEDFIIVTPSGGVSRVTEGATSGGVGWEYDTYTVRLTREPDSGKQVIINIVPAALPPEDEAKGFRDLEFYDPNSLGDLLPYVNGKQLLPVLIFNSGAGWDAPKTIKFRAVNDTGMEGTRQVFINHTTSNSTDALYSDAKMLSVKVQINDDDRAGVIITPSGTGNTVLEGGFTDTFDVVLTRQPSANVTVNLGVTNSQLSLSQTSLTFSANSADANAWNKKQTITITAINDSTVEGFHTDFITYTVVSTDVDLVQPQALYTVDGDPDRDAFNDGLPDDIPPEKPLSYLFLSQRPLLDQAIQIKYDADGDGGPGGFVNLAKYTNQTDSVLRYSITGNTLEFFRNGAPASISGTIQASFFYNKPGYNGALVKDTSIDIYDNDAPGVIITQSDGSTDVIEGGSASTYDTYTVMLTKAPSGPTTITIDSVNTRTTLDGFARFQEQVEVSTDGTTFHSVVFLTFTAANAPQTIWVRARHDTVLDGSDTQVFAPEAHTVSKIRGPLVIEGAAGAGSLSLPAPLMLPGEVNLRPSDGAVQAFTAGTGEGAFEFMNVRKEDLQALINDDTKDFDALADFIEKTLELTEGPGTGVVLDSARPRDLFDRFWLIKEIQAVAGNSNIWRLKLQNPSMVDPGLSNVIAPVATQTKFAITNLSVNFFVDEKQSVDYTTIFDEDAVAARTGRLTSADGNVLSYNNVNNTMVIETADLQALAKLLGIVNLNTGFVNKKIEITVGNGIDRVWTINTVTDGAVAGTKVLGLINVSGSGTPDARSEYRIEGGDRKGRITGFGMGPNVVIGNGVQPGGISYGDMEVLLMSLGSGNDTVIVDYTTNSEDHTTKRDGDFYTLTTLNTGGGNDNITIELQDGDDGALALNTEAGNDTATATGSLGIVMFGGLGNDTLTGGTGEDVIFGDTGRVDYLSNTGEIVTRLGHTVPQSPVNPPVAAVVSSATSNTVSNSLATFTPGSLVGFKVQVTGPNGQAQLRTITANNATQITVDSAWTALPTTDFFYRILFQAANVTIDGVQRATLTDALGNFETAYGGLVGLGLQVISPDGHVQFRQIISNTATQLVLDKPWDTVPVSAGPANINFFYRVASYPEDQTDGVIRGPRVAWSINDSEGGNDTVNGGGGRDLLIGGAGNDVMHGNDGIDFMIGDGGRFDFVPVTGNDGPTILSTVQATAPGIGGVDTMHGDAGNDVLIGGAAGDNISGDANQDILLGDQGLVTLVNGNIVYIQDPGTPGDDWLTGGDDFDLIIGGLGNDKISGLGGADILIGDEGEVFLALDGITITKIDTNTLNPGQGGTDTIFGGDNDDIIIGGANDDRLDGGNDRDLIFGDNVTLNRSAGSGNAIDPRFRTLLPGAAIYGLDGSAQVNLAFDAIVPAIGRPAWGADWTIMLDQTLIASHFGNDYIAGGAHDDEIFGQLGDDTIQGDGTIGPVGGTVPANFIMPSMTFALAAGGNLAVALPTAYGATRSGTLTVVSSFEGTNDGDDYIEGNGGKDVIFGNLGQDDIIGGSSDLFSLTTSSLRPDDADIIFGGAGADYSRNNLGDAALNAAGDTIITAANGHSRDADMILGDNGDIFRLVSVNGASAYLGFTYDDLYGGIPSIPRAAKLIDYTPGGPDFSAAANSDIGAADEIHGESGDDSIYGMKGADVLFGDGQDDDIIGGYGNDWISGGTGDDGVVGDDGRIYTSRDGLTENLYGIAATTQTEISTPGKMQVATINVTGQLKKTVNLTPFSVDPSWPAVNTIDEFGGPDTAATHPHNSDDIIYGGWGNDFLHGGSGDDAISGAEALQAFFDVPTNPGDVLDYAGARGGEFALYDEFNPLAKILNFLLNFSATEGVKVGTVNGTTFYSDGNDVLFGDLSNDWLVGGTGKDNLYGGWGDDLLNADDNLETNGGANDAPDTHTTYEDRAYGGAGRDVLIGNTGGDRLIDWVGEFNSYLVPFAPFGAAAISRTVQPQLPEFLYALSQSDGADPTRDLDNSLPASDPRNGEPLGELGLVLQKDFAWKDQTGAPDDPQAGNIPGGPRDVLRSSNFNDNQAQGFAPDSGTWTVTGGRYQVSPTVLGGDAVSVFYVDSYLPSYFEMLATINAAKPKAGSNANAYVIFDYQSPTDFKFAGINVSTNQLEIGHRNASGWIVDTQTPFPGSVKSETDYNILLSINGTVATITVNNTRTLSFAFAPRVDIYGISHGLSHGMVGLGAQNATAQIDNVSVQIVPPVTTVNKTVDFSAGTTSLFSAPLNGNWNLAAGRYEGSATATTLAIDLTPLHLSWMALLDISVKLNFSVGGEGGIIFDQYGPQDFKFVTISAGKITLGHRTAKGWFTDLVVNNSAIVAGTDYTLGLSLKGTSVSISLNGQSVGGKVYNALVTDGGFGLLSRTGTTSFDTITVKSNDPNLDGQTFALTAKASETGAAEGVVSTELLNEWLASLGTSSLFRDVTLVAVNDLPGDAIAWNVGDGTILIEATAGGYGWFIDPTPAESSEFVRNENGLIASESSPAYGRMDLLTAVMHEIGHLLGHEHGENELMEATIAPGERKTDEIPAAAPRIDWSIQSSGAALTANYGPTRGFADFPDFAYVNSRNNRSGSEFNPKKKRGLWSDGDDSCRSEEVSWLVEI